MNLSSSNNAATSNHPTPVSPELISDPPSGTFEQYRSPLVDSYYCSSKCASLRCSSSIEDPEEPPEVPPLPASHTVQNEIDPLEGNGPPPSYYRSLQTTPNLSPKSNAVNLGHHFPKITSDPPNRKIYHTAPRDKQRVSTSE